MAYGCLCKPPTGHLLTTSVVTFCENKRNKIILFSTPRICLFLIVLYVFCLQDVPSDILLIIVDYPFIYKFTNDANYVG